MKRNNLYTSFQNEIDFIEAGHHKDEELSPSEVVTVSAFERQKAQLISQKIKIQSQLEILDEKVAALEAKIAGMQAS